MCIRDSTQTVGLAISQLEGLMKPKSSNSWICRATSGFNTSDTVYALSLLGLKSGVTCTSANSSSKARNCCGCCSVDKWLNFSGVIRLLGSAALPYYGRRKQVTKMQFLNYGHFWYMWVVCDQQSISVIPVSYTHLTLPTKRIV